MLISNSYVQQNNRILAIEVSYILRVNIVVENKVKLWSEFDIKDK